MTRHPRQMDCHQQEVSSPVQAVAYELIGQPMTDPCTALSVVKQRATIASGGTRNYTLTSYADVVTTGDS